MTYYIDRHATYDQVTYDHAHVRAIARRLKKVRKPTTSIALDPALIQELRREAIERGIPYQVLMRTLIVDGLRNLKKAI